MMLRFTILVFCILVLFGCSSSGGRAPVTDITLATKSKSVAEISYTAKSKASGNVLNQQTYIVQKGDTLYSIAWRAGKSVDELIKLNNINAPYIIKLGETLQLKVKSKTHVDKKIKKEDLPPQNVIKKTNSACTAQNCQKKSAKEVVQKKTKAYSDNKVNKKLIATKSKAVANKKVSAWSWPVKGKLTKRFSSSQSAMQGISIVNERGTPIHAAAPGKVVYAGSGLRGYGKLIIIKHNDDYLSAYAHNEKLLVRENELIKMGQRVAVMGDSGTDQVRLHFEIRYRGKSVDPLRYLPKR